MRIRSILRFLVALAMVAGVFAAGLVLRAPARSLPLPPRDGPSIAAAKSWGYQLQNISAGSIPDAIDIMVVDYSRDGGAGRVLTGREVAALKVRSDGSRRIVLCYLSIGEAESYRGYWRETWPAKPPPWLGPENPKWKGNYNVAFWEPAWQRLIVAPDPTGLTLVQRLKSALDPAPYAYLDTIIDAGFDGGLLDRVDAYEAYDKAPEFRALAAAKMVDFVATISQAAKRRRPGFLIVPQNGEALLAVPAYRAAIDGIVKEDLIFGDAGEGVANDPISTRRAIGDLTLAKSAGLPVFTVEYAAAPEQRRRALDDWRTLGFIGTFAGRALNEPPTLPGEPVAVPPPN